MPPNLTDTEEAPYTDEEADLFAWGVHREPGEPDLWVRVGNARRMRDGAINLRLVAIPNGCRIHLRPARSRRRSRGFVADGASGRPPDFPAGEAPSPPPGLQDRLTPRPPAGSPRRHLDS